MASAGHRVVQKRVLPCKLLVMLLVCCVGRGCCNGCKFCMHALRLSTYTRGSGTEMDFVGLTNSPGGEGLYRKPSLRL